jgi:hypothetical protein
MSHFHAVVWMDHAEAHVLHFTPDEAEKTVVHSAGKHRHIHHHRGTLGSGKAPEDLAYFAAVMKSLEGAQQILLTGPANEKIEFKKHLDAHAKAFAARIVAVENSDHPTDGELLRHARKYFIAADRMHVTH